MRNSHQTGKRQNKYQLLNVKNNWITQRLVKWRGIEDKGNGGGGGEGKRKKHIYPSMCLVCKGGRERKVVTMWVPLITSFSFSLIFLPEKTRWWTREEENISISFLFFHLNFLQPNNKNSLSFLPLPSSYFLSLSLPSNQTERKAHETWCLTYYFLIMQHTNSLVL